MPKTKKKEPDYSQAPVEYFLHPVSETEAARVPFPFTLPFAEREQYMANPPAAIVASAEIVLLPVAPPVEDED
jgi:hypothetical protein